MTNKERPKVLGFMDSSEMLKALIKLLEEKPLNP